MVAACLLGLVPSTAQAEAEAELETTPWRLAASLNPEQSADLLAADASSARDIWAVGAATDASWNVSPLVKHWDGTRWNEVPFGDTAGRPVRLYDVETHGPNDVWVVGSYIDEAPAAGLPDEIRARTTNRLSEQAAGVGTADPIILRNWDGNSWTDVERPAPGVGWTRFALDLTSLGRNSVWLSTMDWNASTNQYTGQLERWDGTSWRTEQLPAAPGGGSLEPQSVTGTGPDDVWVSVLSDKDGVFTPFLYHFDGHRWAVHSVPVPSTREAGWLLAGATTTRDGDLHIVVEANADGEMPQRGAARWDGRTWRQLPAPEYSIINDVTADESGTVWAAGWPVGEPHPVFTRWNGVSWIREDLPTELTSVSWGSTVADMSAVPGTRALVAAGNAACESALGNCGMTAWRGMRGPTA
ncbi:hypothetical protein [Streptomyces sp. T12]|uniref:hypothetical protein n=1 Tax=Streptomyces sp. T12 TaxID=477697 RepID=UPI0011A64AEA|nr:hypothetical protein [Streptomyces sp. T12]